ncbi:MAG: pilus assembly PilX family protein [Nevskiales bacterium]
MKTSITHENGAALVVSLLFLLVLTIIGIASVSTTTLQERMANNTREQNLAFQAAESALRDGEAWLFSQKGTGQAPLQITTCSSNCGTAVGVWSAATTQLSSINSASFDWWQNNGRQHGSDLAGNDNRALNANLHAQQPRYIVQRIQGTFGAAQGSLGIGSGPQQVDLGPFIYRIYGYGVGRIEYTDNGQTRHFDALVESNYRISQF